MRAIGLTGLISLLVACALATCAFFLVQWNRCETAARQAVSGQFTPGKEQMWTIDGPRDVGSPTPHQ
jgi:hypothetical protein